MTASFSERNWRLVWCEHCGMRFLDYGARCLGCGGNRARAERQALEVGRAVRYTRAAGSLPGHERPSGSFFWFQTRLRWRLYGMSDAMTERQRRAIREAYHIEVAHCLDAPDVLPAGSTRSESVADLGVVSSEDDGGGWPVLTEYLREPAVSPGEPRPEKLDSPDRERDNHPVLPTGGDQPD